MAEEKIPEETIPQQVQEQHRLDRRRKSDKLSHGKKIGYIAFIITELIIIFVLWMIFEDWLTDKRMEKLLTELGRNTRLVNRSIEPGLLGNILFYQFGLFMVVWGAGTAKNFTDAMTAKFTGTK